MRTNTSIGLGVAIAALIVGVVYVTRWNVESPPPSTNVAGTQRAEQQLARPSDSSAIGSESSLSTSKPPRANYSTGFADASPINPTTDRATSVIASDADTIRFVRSLKLSNDDSDRLLEILNAEQ